MTRIAQADAEAMNKLYAQELGRAGVKTAADEKIDAFDDHAEYVDTLESVLGEKDSFDPNDVMKD